MGFINLATRVKIEIDRERIKSHEIKVKRIGVDKRCTSSALTFVEDGHARLRGQSRRDDHGLYGDRVAHDAPF